MTVLVTAVRPMTVDMVHLFVDMLMSMGLLESQLMRMVVMHVRMDVGVRMCKPSVIMGMDVLFADDEGHRGGHEQTSRSHRRLDLVAEDEDRGKCTGKWCQAE